MKFVRLLLVPFALLIVALIRLVSPWILIRFGEHWDFRLGHLMGNTECYLCEKDAGLQPKAFDIWISRGSSNSCIEKKYRALLHIYPAWIVSIVSKVNILFNGHKKHYIELGQFDRDIHNLWEKHAPHIGFTKDEESRGKRLLQELGVAENAKWVCLFVRDSEYLKIKYPGKDWSYHDYRDSDINDCTKAALALAERGYYVLRMGEIVGRTFFTSNPRIIDYSTSGKRSDFGDLYLTAKCEFFLGTSSGLMAIAQVFNRPIAIINYAPLGYLQTSSKGLAIWKHHVKDGKRMTLEEIYASEVLLCTNGPKFDYDGITLENNTPQEIYDLAMEMADTVEGRITEEDQSAFWDKFPFHLCQYGGKPLHGKVKLRIGREFLKNYLTKS